VSFVTPVDGQDAVAEHVAQITETLNGVRAEPITLTSTLAVGGKPVAVSPTGGNALTWDATGLWAPAGGGGGLDQATADLRYLQLTGGTLSGNLVIDNAAGTVLFSLNGQVGADRRVQFQTDALSRWNLNCDGIEEEGANSGSNFRIQRYADDGAGLGTALAISRATGIVDFTVTPTVLGVPIGGMSQATADARYLQLTGGTLTGDLVRNGPDLSDRLIRWQTAGQDRWRLGIKDTEADGNDAGSDMVLSALWDSDGEWYDVVTFDRYSAETHFPRPVFFDGSTPTNIVLRVRSSGDTADRLNVVGNGGLRWGTGISGWDVTLQRTGTGLLGLDGSLNPGTNTTYDLGTTALRWRKLWATDAEFTNTPTINGVALSSTYLPLAGGTVTGATTFTGGSVTISQSIPLNLSQTGVATVGNLRLANSEAIAWRDAAGTGNFTMAFSNIDRFQLLWGALDRFNVDNKGTTRMTPDAGFPALVADGNVGVGATPHASWPATQRALQVARGGALWGASTNPNFYIASNSYYDGTVWRALQGNYPGLMLKMENGSLVITTATQVAQDATFTYLGRYVFTPTGQVQISPDPAVAALTIGGTPQPKITVNATAPSSPMPGDLWVW
jgi:hypothetical protein